MEDVIPAALAAVPAQYVGYVMTAVAVCSLLDAYVPQPPAGSRWVPVRRAVSFLAQNVHFARNAVPAGSIPAPVAKAAGQVQQLAAAVEQSAGELAASSAEAAAAAARPEGSGR